MSRHRRKSGAVERYVALYHWIMDKPAWRELDCVSRAAYLELGRRYAGPGSNNGRIPYSVREMAEALRVSKATAQRAFQRLIEHGFIARMKKGAFSLKVRHASEWRLTEHKCDVTQELATKDFARWQKQKPVRPENPTGYQNDTERAAS